MKSLKALLLACAAMLVVAVPASAQFRIGPRIGTEVNSMRLNKEVFDNENRAGFTGGVMCEFTVPIINLGFDLSVMYVHRVNQNTYIENGNQDNSELINSSAFKKRDYIEIPLNLKYKIGLPVVGKIISPYIFTGPSFSILASKREITNAYRNKAFDVAWNVGVGLELVSHLQIGASYGFGMNKTVEWIGQGVQANPIDGKNNYWTITAAWLF
ncbi:MAG: PorT family protein [Muribaculaceae bacterium]|nr:PorT family protein [Muribaculaceae bacterium]